MKKHTTSNSPSTVSSTRSRGSRIPLVVVESPSKAKAIKGYLGDGYMVEASVGHVADIPKHKNSVRPQDSFAVTYELTDKGTATIALLRKLMKRASKLVLATDADREGELIAAHLVEFLQPTIPIERIVFQSVTKEAILDALANPREIDHDLVEAARARRIIDRLYGFEVSPILWAKVRANLSAGRVQSPALRLIVERELERQRFVSASYSGITGVVSVPREVELALTHISGERLAIGKDFVADGQPIGGVRVLTSVEADALAANLAQGTTLTVVRVKEQSTTRKPQPPFTLSTLLQAAGNKLGMSSEETTRIAGKLYEAGHVTYVRTDNAMLSPMTAAKLRNAAQRAFGDEYIAPKIRYVGGGKKAFVQGAHEGIHPTRPDVQRVRGIGEREHAVYALILQRALASQMADSRLRTRSITLEGEAPNEAGTVCTFTASGSITEFPGHRIAFGRDGGADDELPDFAEGDTITVSEFEAKHHATTPPARFNESSLVKELEELGIGRPSTYVPIMKKLRERYVWSKPGDRALVPTMSAFAVHRLMSRHFADLVDYDFTKEMEETLDKVSVGESSKIDVLTAFFFGGGDDEWPGLEALVSGDVNDIPADDLIALDLGVHPDSGKRIVVRSGVLRKRGVYTPYVECGDVKRGITDETPLDDLTLDKVLDLLSHEPSQIGVIDDVPVFLMKGQKGHYFQWGSKEVLPPGHKKPRTAGLMTSMSFDSVTIDDAERMFALPRTLGVHPDTGDDVSVLFGPFGAYVKSGENTRSLRPEEEAFTIDLEAAITLLATPKSYRGRRRKK